MVLPAREEAMSRVEQRERAERRQLQERRFGPHAPELRALEARLNQAFDRAVRTSNPPLWPSVALRTSTCSTSYRVPSQV